MQARYARRVTVDDVGERVSIRHLVDDPDGGPVPTDVVGRLLSFDDEVLLVIDRSGQLHAIGTAEVVSSRTVPPHPRLPPEPDVGSEDRPVERDAARVLLLDSRDRVLLAAHVPHSGRRVWTAPGGGLRPGEEHVAAAQRELREELGVDLDVGPWVWSRSVLFTFRGIWLRQHERWYLARGELDAASAPLDDVAVDEARWWSLEELRGTDELLAPEALPDHLADLLAHGPPGEPVDVGR
jgi:8-oxo-dGTP pyrophosphatase MutT (NUDIX family)